VRFGRYLFLRTDHDGYHGYPRELLFDLERDPHEQHDRLALEPAVAERARELLQGFVAGVLGSEARDPLAIVLEQGGPFHVRGRLPDYVKRLRATGRAGLADALERAHPSELAPAR
jgi:hypothetical protein